MNLKKVIIILSCCVALVSCIKENRDKCPCFLHVDLSRVDSHYVHKLDLILTDRLGEDIPQWYQVDRSYIGDTLILEVDKSEFEFSAWGNLVNSRHDDDMRTITSVYSSDSLWSYYNHVSTKCEDAWLSVVADRQYIPVTIIVRGMLQGISNVRPSLDNISGSLMYDGTARGPGSTHEPALVMTPNDESPYYLFKTMILTQVSATDVMLRLLFEKEGKQVDNVFPLGKLLSDLGEDISAVNQNPILIDITIGAADILLTIRVSEWHRHGIYTITY